MSVRLWQICRKLLVCRPNTVNLKCYQKNYIESSYNLTSNYRLLSVSLNAENLKLTENEFRIVYNTLKTDYIQSNRVNANNLIEAKNELDRNSVTNEESLFLLNCCGSLLPDKTISFRLELLKEIWGKVVGDNVPSKEQVCALLRVYRDNRFNIPDFNKFLNEMKCDPDIDIYHDLIILACENGNVHQGLEILAEMKRRNLSVTELVFNSLIVGYSRSNNLKECESVFDTMTAAGIEPGSETYCRMMEAFIENKRPEKALKILNEHGLSFNQDQIYRLIKTSAMFHESLIPNLIKFFPENIQNDVQISLKLKSICIELVYQKKFNECLLILNSLPKPIFQPNEDTDVQGKFLINEMIKSETSIENLITVCRSLIDNQRNLRALHVATEISIRRESSFSYRLLREISLTEKLRPHYFWPLILSSFKNNGENSVLEIIKIMSEFGVEFDYETINFYILPKISLTLKDPKNAIKILNNYGLKTTNLMTPLISHLIYQQKFNDIHQLLKLYPTKIDLNILVTPLVIICTQLRINKNENIIVKLIKILIDKSITNNYDIGGQLLMELISNNKMKYNFINIANLIKEFKNEKIFISNIAGEVLQQHFSRNKDDNLRKDICQNIKLITDKKLQVPSGEFFDAHISHPRDMNLDELECHLTELNSKNLNTRGILRRILQLSVREGKLERALEIKKLCDEQKVDNSPGMLASTFELFIKTKSVENAEKIYGDMTRIYPGFMIDEHKIIDFAALLVENGDIEKGINILKQRAQLSKVKGGNSIHKNLWNLLTNCATLASTKDIPTSGDENLTKELLNTLVQLGYCTFHNTLLGPVIREYILKNDLHSAVKIFKNFVEKYRKTPLHQELMTLLVKISNYEIETENQTNITPTEAKEYLEEIVNAASSVHGHDNVHINLIIALSECGTEKQLRKLLINPKIRINTALLLKQCEYLSNNNKVETILRLAKCSRDLGHLIKDYELYNILLNTFIQENNYKMAILLFEKIIIDELKVTQEFKRLFVNLLQKNNIEIPTNLALHLN